MLALFVMVRRRLGNKCINQGKFRDECYWILERARVAYCPGDFRPIASL